MNIIEGMILGGLTLNTEKNFNSIPGLMQWNDGRERVEVAGGKISLWGDKSSQGNNLYQYTVAKQPTYEKGLWVTSNDVGIYLKSNRKDYNFLHNGQKYGIYAIQKPVWSLATPISAANLIFTGGAGFTGLQGILGSNLGSGRSGYILRGSASSPSKLITNLLDVASPNYSPSNAIYTTSFVNMGQTLGVKILHGNAVATSPAFFPTMAEYPTGNHYTFTAIAGATGITAKVGMLLVYNWTGYTGSQVASFDAQVMALLNQEKLVFQNLDI
ncbi:hypothetical protein [Flavobacterium sp.]|uniref:hypothetical protein n=1 Tax=Flavobacterium sp. TaxID=239 RepID=UPI004034E23A